MDIVRLPTHLQRLLAVAAKSQSLGRCAAADLNSVCAKMRLRRELHMRKCDLHSSVDPVAIVNILQTLEGGGRFKFPFLQASRRQE
jgi:hypothetical protein